MGWKTVRSAPAASSERTESGRWSGMRAFIDTRGVEHDPAHRHRRLATAREGR